MRTQRDIGLIIAGVIIVFIVPLDIITKNFLITCVIKVVTIILLIVIIISFPLLKLAVSEIGSVPITKLDVLTTTKANIWLTVPEIKKNIEQKKRLCVSLHQVMRYTFELAEEGILEGRERLPPQPAYFSGGSIWEYRFKM